MKSKQCQMHNVSRKKKMNKNNVTNSFSQWLKDAWYSPTRLVCVGGLFT